MSYETIALVCKSVSLFMFLPIFLGVAFWAYRRKNKAVFEAYALAVLEED